MTMGTTELLRRLIIMEGKLMDARASNQIDEHALRDVVLLDVEMRKVIKRTHDNALDLCIQNAIDPDAP